MHLHLAGTRAGSVRLARKSDQRKHAHTSCAVSNHSRALFRTGVITPSEPMGSPDFLTGDDLPTEPTPSPSGATLPSDSPATIGQLLQECLLNNSLFREQQVGVYPCRSSKVAASRRIIEVTSPVRLFLSPLPPVVSDILPSRASET